VLCLKTKVLLVLASGAVLSCGASDQVSFPSGGATGMGGAGTSSASSGTGGAGGNAPPGHDATETANAGTVVKNAEYRMIFTLGQPSLGQQKAAAGGLRVQGGLIGATENTP
jgi:hypothetical protein